MESFNICDFCKYGPPSSGDGKPCVACPADGKMVITNGDYLRSMKISELAEWLNYYAHDGYINPACGWDEWLIDKAKEE